MKALVIPQSASLLSTSGTGISNNYYQAYYTMDNYFDGYANTTSAVNAIQFSMSSGNIDAGTIKLYGIKDS